jgi:RNA polymerase sigma-70 factor (ECF subfamily)
MAQHSEKELTFDTDTPDAHLVARANGGDVGAFGQLYQRHSGRLHALCLRLTGDRATAGELTQDVFVLAWEKLGDYRGESLFTSWLHRIAVNAFLGMRRARSRRTAWLDGFRNLLRSRGAESGAHPALRIDLETAISRLPDSMRAVFVLHDVEGYRHREVAEMLGVAPGTCKAQLHNARRKLREELEK